MPVLVDTYNLLHITGILPPEYAGIDVHGLAAMIARSRYRRQQVTLICDGTPRSRESSADAPSSRLRIVYAGPGREADDEITDLIDRDSAPRRLLVISNDHRIRQHARRRKARTLACETFLRRLVLDARHASPGRKQASPRRPIEPLDEKQITAWYREFGINDHTSPPASHPPAPSPPISDISPADDAAAALPADRSPVSRKPRADGPLDPNDLDWLDMNDWIDDDRQNPR